MENFNEKELNIIYDEVYRKQPLAYGIYRRKSILYSKGWVVQIGMACMPPHPHRYYTFGEFVKKLENDKEFLEFLRTLKI